MTNTTAVDLFAGPGGWDVAATDLGIEVVGIEWDAQACATRRAAGLRTIEGSVLDYGARHFPADGLIASPPCQTFSLAGRGDGRRALDDVLATIKQLEADTDHAMPAHVDERTALVVEPLRWVLEALDDGEPYRWLAFEQVPTVLPVWQAVAEVLERAGYGVATGILSAEQYGVPQTRRRAVLVARYGAEVALPAPTHSRYYSRDRRRLDGGVLPWVSMAEALGWGMSERPSMTVTSGGSATGGAEPFGNAARQGMAREAEAGRWIMNAAGATGLAPCGVDEPAATVTDKGTTAWVLRSNYSGAGDGTAAERGRTIRELDQPATAITGRPPAWAPAGEDAHRQARDGGAHQRRVSVAEAAALQTFPPDYPWQGNLGKRYEQVGNAVPPLLARAILSVVIS